MSAQDGCFDDNVIAGYLDGRLRGQELQDAEAHLAACTACLDKVMEARVFLKVDIVEAPLGIRQKVKDLVGGDDEGEGWSWPWWLEAFLTPNRSLGLAMVSVIIVIACFAGTQFGYMVCDGIGVAVELVSAEGSDII